MISPLGLNAQMTSTSVAAKISAYKASEYLNQNDKPITMATVPDQIFHGVDVKIEEGSYYREQYDRIIKMALIALQDLFTRLTFDQSVFSQAIPLIMAMPEAQIHSKQIPTKILTANLLNCGAPFDDKQIRYIHTGRASGIQSLELAHRYLYELNHDFVIIGGSDSYKNYPLLTQLAEKERLLAPGSPDGFAPAEAASFILLTRHPEYAQSKNNHIIALHPIGQSEEPGHINSEEPYQGNGLDQAFKQALQRGFNSSIDTIYCSMNGEGFWAKEQGVAMMRNSESFSENTLIEHPADCYGELGAATGTMLIGLSAMSLLKQSKLGTHLIYSSSDGPARAAVVAEKIKIPMNESLPITPNAHSDRQNSSHGGF